MPTEFESPTKHASQLRSSNHLPLRNHVRSSNYYGAPSTTEPESHTELEPHTELESPTELGLRTELGSHSSDRLGRAQITISHRFPPSAANSSVKGVAGPETECLTVTTTRDDECRRRLEPLRGGRG